jgi:predicted RNA-binding protein
MCELKVIIDETVVFEDAVYAKSIEKNVVVKGIFGNSKTFENYTITEVNITNEQLVLTPTKT